MARYPKRQVTNRTFPVAVFIAISVVDGSAPGLQIDPTSVRDTAIERVIVQSMQLCGASASTVAIGNREKIVFQQGYGFSDRQHDTSTRADTTMRIASCTKPVTRAAVEILIRQNRLQRDTRIFDFLGIPPAGGTLGDERIRQITLDHLLNHRGGWDRETTIDPLFSIDEIGRQLKTVRVEKRHLVKYMWSMPLQFDPGTEERYSNFGFLLLGLAIEKVTGKSWIESVRELIATPLDIDDFSLSSATRSARSPDEVFYARESNINSRIRDASDGLTTSAPSLCKFMAAYWLDGIPRSEIRDIYLFQFGTHPETTTAIMEQRLDGLHYVLLFNSRREDTYVTDNETIRDQFNRMLNTIAGELGD